MPQLFAFLGFSGLNPQSLGWVSLRALERGDIQTPAIEFFLDRANLKQRANPRVTSHSFLAKRCREQLGFRFTGSANSPSQRGKERFVRE